MLKKSLAQEARLKSEFSNFDYIKMVGDWELAQCSTQINHFGYRALFFEGGEHLMTKMNIDFLLQIRC